MNILMLGCGALGSRIAIELQGGHRLSLLDMDRVGEENIGTSAFFKEQVGMSKVDALAELCYRRNIVVDDVYFRELFRVNVARIAALNFDLAVCTFDTFTARRLAHKLPVPVLHVGLSESLSGLIGMAGYYPLGTDTEGGNPVCTHLLGVGIISTTAVIAANAIRAGIVQNQLIFVTDFEVTRCAM